MQHPPPSGPAGDLEAEIRRLRALLQAAGVDPDGAVVPARGEFDRLLLDTMSEGFYVVDTAGRTVQCNGAMVRLLGFDSPDDLIGRSIHEIVHHSHRDGTPYPVEDCPIYRAAREGISMVVDDEVFFRRDGTALPIEYRTEPLIRDGHLEGAVCTFVDITARLEAELRLRESEARLALSVDAAGIGIFDLDVETSALRWDDRVRALFGLAAGKPITLEANLAAIHPDDRDRVTQTLGAAFDPANGGAYEVAFRAIGIEDGTLRWVEAQGRATFRDGRAVRLMGVARDVSAAKEAEHHLRLMVNELNHRVKNSLAMVQGVAAQTFRQAVDMDMARVAFTERLVALAQAHDVLTAANWDGADMRQVVEMTALSHGGRGQRFDVEGDGIVLSPKAVLAFSMALHELATNAMKYGALSNDVGRVAIRWTARGDGGDRQLRFTWTETGGPVVEPPQRRGFGSKMIERGLASELQGEVRILFPATGVICSIDAPFPS